MSLATVARFADRFRSKDNGYLDADGNGIARGLVVGEPVEVPPGRYTERVEAASARPFRDVSAVPGGAKELSLKEG